MPGFQVLSVEALLPQEAHPGFLSISVREAPLRHARRRSSWQPSGAKALRGENKWRRWGDSRFARPPCLAWPWASLVCGAGRRLKNVRGRGPLCLMGCCASEEAQTGLKAPLSSCLRVFVPRLSSPGWTGKKAAERFRSASSKFQSIAVMEVVHLPR